MKNVFYGLYAYWDDNEILQYDLEISFVNKDEKPIMHKFHKIDKFLSSSQLIKKYIKNRIPELKTQRIKLKCVPEKSFYVPAIIYAIANTNEI